MAENALNQKMTGARYKGGFFVKVKRWNENYKKHSLFFSINVN